MAALRSRIDWQGRCEREHHCLWTFAWDWRGVQMAEEFQLRGVMLLAPDLSISKLARIDFPFFPSSYFALDRFENENKMGNIHAPLLIVNVDQDQVVPPSQ